MCVPLVTSLLRTVRSILTLGLVALLGITLVGTASATSAPAAPSGVSVITGDKAARVNWLAPLDTGGSPITGYTATATPGGQFCASTGELTCRITGLTNGKSYTFTVTATSATGTSTASDPTAPITLSYAPGGTNAAVSVNARAQCASGTTVLAVYVLNKESVPISARITTGIGEQSITALAAGAPQYLSFPVRR